MALDWTPLNRVVDHLPASVSVGVAAQTNDGNRWSTQGNTVFPSASTAKIAIMVALHQAIDQGEVSLDERYTLAAKDQVAGSGVLRHLQPGLQWW